MIEQIPWGEDESLGRAWWDESAKICNATNQQKIFAACYHSGWTATASARAAKYSGNEDTLLLGPTDGLPSKDWTAVECDARCPACRTAPLCWSDTQRCRVRIGERLTHAARMGDKAKPSDRRNTGGFAVQVNATGVYCRGRTGAFFAFHSGSTAPTMNSLVRQGASFGTTRQSRRFSS
jgi:hypothetical protein